MKRETRNEMRDTNSDMKSKRIAILSPVAWRTPPRAYGAWETVAGNITEGLVARGWKDVTLFATKESLTKAKLEGWVEKGYEEDKSQIPLVSTCLHISKVMERAGQFDLIHNNFDYLPLTYLPFIKTPMLTTIHGFSDPDILRVYHDHKDTYYVSISDSDRDPGLPYLATVYNGIDLSNLTFRQTPGDKLVHYGRIHNDKGTHLAIEVAKKCGVDLIIAGIIQDQKYFDELVKPHLNQSSIQYIGPVDPVQRDGYLVNNVDEAAEAVGKIDRIDRWKCRQRVEENFTIDCMVAGYEKVYEEIFRREQQNNGHKDTKSQRN